VNLRSWRIPALSAVGAITFLASWYGSFVVFPRQGENPGDLVGTAGAPVQPGAPVQRASAGLRHGYVSAEPLLQLVSGAEKKTDLVGLRRVQFGAVERLADAQVLDFVRTYPDRRYGLFRVLSVVRGRDAKAGGYRAALEGFLKRSGQGGRGGENAASFSYIALESGHRSFVDPVLSDDSCFAGVLRFFSGRKEEGEAVVETGEGGFDSWVYPAQRARAGMALPGDGLRERWGRMGPGFRRDLASWGALRSLGRLSDLIRSSADGERDELALAVGEGLPHPGRWLDTVVEGSPRYFSDRATTGLAKLWSYKRPDEVIVWASRLERDLRDEVERTAAFFMATNHPALLRGFDFEGATAAVKLGVLHGLITTDPGAAVTYFTGGGGPEEVDMKTRLWLANEVVPTSPELAPQFFLDHVAAEYPPGRRPDVFEMMKTIGKMVHVYEENKPGGSLRWVGQLPAHLQEYGFRYFVQTAAFRGERDRVSQALRETARSEDIFFAVAAEALAVDPSLRAEVEALLPEDMEMDAVESLGAANHGLVKYEPW